MTAAPGSAHRRTLQDELLDDLRQAPDRPAAVPVPAAGAARASAASESAPAVELRITPRSWTAAGWTRRPDGVTISLGPVRLALGNLRP
jgi:hypothetical protein